MGKNLAIGCGALLALLVGIVIIAALASGGSKQPSVPAAPDKSPTVAASKPPAVATKPARTPQVLLDVGGSGSKTTQKFTAGGDWDLNWNYDCSNFGYQGNFQVYVYNGDGSLSFENQGVNQLGTKGNDVDHYHHSGTFYLTINSECDWHVQAVG